MEEKVVRIYDVNDLLVVAQDCFSSIIRVCELSNGESLHPRARLESVSLLSAIPALKTTIDRCCLINYLIERCSSAVDEEARTCASRARQKHTKKIVTRINTSSKNIDIDSDKDTQRIAELRYYFSTIVLAENTARRDSVSHLSWKTFGKQTNKFSSIVGRSHDRP